MLTIPVNLRTAFKAQIQKKKRKNQANLATHESCIALESKVCAFLSLPKVLHFPVSLKVLQTLQGIWEN